jgi:ABC-type oligopeptide transport system substrate-binding subunit
MFVAGTKESASLKWGQYICDELRNTLGINVEILTGDFAAREKAIAKNEIDIWSVGWVPDYPDPESYFSLFYNRSRQPGFEASVFPYLSSEYYNQCYYSATIERNVEKRQGLFNSCDSILRSEAIILPILIDDFVAIINLRVRNFKLNPLGIVDFSTVYIKELN